VVVTKNLRRQGRVLHLATITVELATRAGFAYLQRVVALLAAVGDGQLHARPSFWQLTQTRRARARGQPAHLVVHEDVSVFVRPPAPTPPSQAVQPHACHGRPPSARSAATSSQLDQSPRRGSGQDGQE
jgi:hypothetical protein